MLTERTLRRVVALATVTIAVEWIGPRPEAQSGITITFPARLAAGPD